MTNTRSHDDGELAAEAQAKLAALPPLTYGRSGDRDERIAALKLVADSVAQLRQVSAYTIITHPYLVAVYMLAAAVMIDLLYLPKRNLALLVTTLTGFMMAVLVGVRGYTAGWLALAESVGWDWLGDGDGDGEIMVVRYGDDVIGACVYRVVSVEPAGSARKGGSRRATTTAKRGEIRAWTIRRRERGRGVGTGLLEEVVKDLRNRGCEGVEMESDSLYERKIVPAVFNKVITKRMRRCREVLKRVVDEVERAEKTL